jgi:hypothetical protein
VATSLAGLQESFYRYSNLIVESSGQQTLNQNLLTLQLNYVDATTRNELQEDDSVMMIRLPMCSVYNTHQPGDEGEFG